MISSGWRQERGEPLRELILCLVQHLAIFHLELDLLRTASAPLSIWQHRPLLVGEVLHKSQDNDPFCFQASLCVFGQSLSWQMVVSLRKLRKKEEESVFAPSCRSQYTRRTTSTILWRTARARSLAKRPLGPRPGRLSETALLSVFNLRTSVPSLS